MANRNVFETMQAELYPLITAMMLKSLQKMGVTIIRAIFSDVPIPHFSRYYRYQHLESIPILPILFNLLGTINKSFCKQHQRMHLLNLACFYIWNIFYMWYLSLFIVNNIVANLKKKS